MSTSPIFVATLADKVCTRMSIYCPDDLDLERGKRLARYAYESRTGKPAASFTKAPAAGKARKCGSGRRTARGRADCELPT